MALVQGQLWSTAHNTSSVKMLQLVLMCPFSPVGCKHQDDWISSSPAVSSVVLQGWNQTSEGQGVFISPHRTVSSRRRGTCVSSTVGDQYRVSTLCSQHLPGRCLGNDEGVIENSGFPAGLLSESVPTQQADSWGCQPAVSVYPQRTVDRGISDRGFLSLVSRRIHVLLTRPLRGQLRSEFTRGGNDRGSKTAAFQITPPPCLSDSLFWGFWEHGNRDKQHPDPTPMARWKDAHQRPPPSNQKPGASSSQKPEGLILLPGSH